MTLTEFHSLSLMEMKTHFLCRAEYQCPCFPPGKPVSLATAKRHRKRANDERIAAGLPKLPSALHYSEELAIQELARYFHLFESDGVAPGEQIVTSSRKSAMNDDDVLMVESVDVEDFQMELRTAPIIEREDRNSIEQAVLTDERSYLSPFPHAIQGHTLHSIDRERIYDTSFLHCESLHEEYVCSSPSSEESAPDSEDSYFKLALDDEEQDSSNESLDDEEKDSSNESLDACQVYTSQDLMKESFLSWMAENRKWLDMAINGGMKQTMWADLLRNLNSPYRAYVTVKRNMLRHAGLSTRTYLCCRRHTLLFEINNEEHHSVEENRTCTQCVEEGLEPSLSTFEYIPVQPRLRAWVADPKSCELLYKYRWDNCNDERGSAYNEGRAETMHDYFDGWIYRELIESLGGEECAKFDVFIAPSCDGFITYKHSDYDCWIIAAINMNLPPSIRFYIRNLIPLGFVKGPQKPARIDSYFRPLLSEIHETAEENKFLVFHDGVQRMVRLHVLWFTGDLPALASMCGLRGHNGRSPCRFCQISGVWCSTSRHYYFPSRILEMKPSGKRCFRELCSVGSLRLRNPENVLRILHRINDKSISKKCRDELGVSQGLKMRTILYEFPFFNPFMSVPIDSMHLIMNISKDLMGLLRGKKHALKFLPPEAKQFVIIDSSWKSIDEELLRVPSGTSEQVFGQPPRVTEVSDKWKSIECSDFFRYYACILFEGHLSPLYLKGVALYSRIIDLLARPTLNNHDISLLGRLCIQFYRHFEKHYYGFERQKLSFCKYTIHLLLHLEDGVRAWGPPVTYSQYWVERFIGYYKHRLNARRLAAESFLESTKMTEAYKMLLKENFLTKETTSFENYELSENWLLSPSFSDFLKFDYHKRKKTSMALSTWLQIELGITAASAKNVLTDVSIRSHGRMLLHCSNALVRVGAFDTPKRRKRMARADWFIAAEFEDNADSKRTVYYGQVLRILDVTFNALLDGEGRPRREILLLTGWASNLIRTSTKQVYRAARLESTFTNATIVARSAVLNLVGVMEHRMKGGWRTYIIDPQREVHGLLDDEVISPDGFNRTLVL